MVGVCKRYRAIYIYVSSVLEGSKVAYHGSPLFSTLRLPFQLPMLSNVGPFLTVINPHSPRSSFPSMNPSMILTNKFRLELLTIWPKNDDLRFATFFNSVGFSLIRSNTSLFVVLFIQLIWFYSIAPYFKCIYPSCSFSTYCPCLTTVC